MSSEVGRVWKRTAVLVIVLLSFSSTTVLSAQVNLECISAIPLTSTPLDINSWHQVSLDNMLSAPGCIGDAQDDKWYSFIASSPNDMIEAISEGIPLDLVVEFSSGCDAADVLACFDNYSAGQTERVVPGGLTVGETYYFRVYDRLSDGAGNNIKVQVKTFIDGGLNTSYCGIYDYQLANSVYAERDDLGQLYTGVPVSVNGYRFKFVNVANGFSNVYAHPNLEPYIQLVNIGMLQHGENYEVLVQHRVQINANGGLMNIWSDFGSPCEIGMDPNLPTTQLIPSLCPAMQDLDFESWIGASSVLGADQYRFTFNGGGETIVKTTNGYGFNLSQLGTDEGGLKYGSTLYDVDVQININGQWSEQGQTCQIGMVSQPNATKLNSTYCGGVYTFPDPNFILADFIYGATAYEFQFQSLDEVLPPINEVTAGLALPFHLMTNDLVTGNYKVFVRAFAGGVWGDFSESCSISIDAGSQAQPNDTDQMKAYESLIESNSMTYSKGLLSFDLMKASSEKALVSVFDLSGRLVYSSELNFSSSDLSYTLPLELPEGQSIIVLYGEVLFYQQIVNQ